MIRRSLILLLFVAACGPALAAAASYSRTLENYQVPDVTLLNQDGERVRLREVLLPPDRPVLVDFIYTTCTTICPVLSVNFVNFQRTIKNESAKVQLVSISIDPEFDTPRELMKYMKRYEAKPGWQFLTGSRQDIDRVLKSFNVYTVNKMEHLPVTLLKSPADSRWVRIYGLISTGKLLVEYEKVKP